ncbi:molybdenum cofactor biosynthesis prote [Trichodelitschia bisporula]|uniref:Molybdenum cofactor biosynthesis prote n=1 Tax=Trichodelitschia bisporula TaxID=703511 RepID=A0A6G1HKH3_9PEZI|nr:molybdenum cofactor biosynthesis prote [Trichodelitschia bisporula]
MLRRTPLRSFATCARRAKPVPSVHPTGPSGDAVVQPPAARRREMKPFSEFLTDGFGRQHNYLRISITERCNLRCVYCMPEEGVPLSPPAHLLTTPEITYLSALFVSQGVTKIRLTGGEPTVRKDIVPLMRGLGALRSQGLKELALTTNGLALGRKLDAMVEAGLTGINLSLDTLDPFQFQIMTRRKGFERVVETMDRILEMKKLGARLTLKVNCVVMRGINEAEVVRFVELGREKDVEVRFIEYMPFGGNRWAEKKMVSYREMVELIRAKYPDLHRVRGHLNDTSKTYQVPGFVGKVGFITSMTENFCGTCNRLRITSDGNLKVCLHGNAEVSLRDVLREANEGRPIDEAAFEAMRAIEREQQHSGILGDTPLGWGAREARLLGVIGQAVRRKKEKHAGIGQLEKMENRPMILIDRATRTPWSHIPSHLLSPSLHTHQLRFASTWIRNSRRQQEPVDPGSRRSFKLRKMFLESVKHFITELDDLLRFVRLALFAVLSKKQVSEMQERDVSPDELAEAVERALTPPALTPPEHVLEERTLDDLRTIYSPEWGQWVPGQGCEFGVQGKGKVDGRREFSTSSRRQNEGDDEAGKGSQLTHLTPTGTAHMVHVGGKPWTARSAIASCEVHFTSAATIELVRSAALKKGDVLAVARIAGIQAAKLCPSLIPLCHPILIDGVDVDVEVNEGMGRYGGVRVRGTVRCTGPTGVEMEALCAVTGAALAVVDMVKGVDRGVRIEGVGVVEKRGGRSGVWRADEGTE